MNDERTQLCNFKYKKRLDFHLATVKNPSGLAIVPKQSEMSVEKK
jgi:hypothetical protein